MPQNLTDSDSFDTVTGPSATDIRNAASVRTHLQTLANRTRYLFSRLLPYVADFTALKAIDTTGLADGTVRLVKGQGMYTLDTASGAAEFLPFIVDPTTGPGRWISATAHLTSRVVRAWPGNRLIGWEADSSATSPDVSGSSLGSTVIGETAAKRYYGGLKPSSVSATNRHWYVVSLDPYVLDGATLTSAVFTVAPANHASFVPANLPRVSIIRVQSGGTRAAHLLAAGSVVDPNGTLAPYNAEHSITFTPDQNNVIDKSQYGYLAFIGDEGGVNALAGAWWRYIDLNFTTPDARGT